MANSDKVSTRSFSIARILAEEGVKEEKRKKLSEDGTPSETRLSSKQNMKSTLNRYFGFGDRHPSAYHPYFPATGGCLHTFPSPGTFHPSFHREHTSKDNQKTVSKNLVDTDSAKTEDRHRTITFNNSKDSDDKDTRLDVKKIQNDQDIGNGDDQSKDSESDSGEEEANSETNQSPLCDQNNYVLIKPKKKTRTVFSRHQIFYLESAFDTKRYLSSTERAEIATALNLTETQVKVWFQNRRNKWKSQITGAESGLHSERYPNVFLNSTHPLSLAASSPSLHFYGHPMFYF